MAKWENQEGAKGTKTIQLLSKKKTDHDILK